MPSKTTIKKRKITNTTQGAAGKRKNSRPKYCGNGTVPINGACVPVELGFQLNQSMSNNPINNYAEIQGMMASKTVLDDRAKIVDALHYINSQLLVDIVNKKKGARNYDPQPSEWLWIKE